MEQKDLTALTEIIKHNLPLGNPRVAFVNTLVKYLEAEHQTLDTTEIRSLTNDFIKPIPTITQVKTIGKQPIKVVKSENDNYMDAIPRVLCKLKQETGYGVASEGDDG